MSEQEERYPGQCWPLMREIAEMERKVELLEAFVAAADRDAALCDSCEHCVDDDLYGEYIEAVIAYRSARLALDWLPQP